MEEFINTPAPELLKENKDLLYKILNPNFKKI